MKTTEIFSIKASTNPYIASRDAMFNGKTSVIIDNELTYDDARKRLTKLAINDYESMNHIERVENEDDYLRFYFSGFLYEKAQCVGMSEDDYFQSHKRLLKVLYEKNKKMFERFTGAGLYGMGQIQASAILLDSDNSYEYDSRHYSII